jgi:hypothetical protein
MTDMGSTANGEANRIPIMKETTEMTGQDSSAAERFGIAREWRRGSRIGAVLATLSLVLVAAFALWHSKAEATQDQAQRVTEEETRALVAKRGKLARQAVDLITRKTPQGPLVNNPRHELYLWSLRLLGAEIYLSMNDEELKVEDPEVYLAVAKARPSAARERAFDDHLKRMQAWEAGWRLLVERNVMSPFQLLEVQHHVLEAQLWVNREKLKQQKAADAKAR